MGGLPFLGLREQGSPAEKDVGQRTQHRELRRVFGQAFIAKLPVPPEVLDDPERMFHLGSNPGMPTIAFLL